MNEEEKQRASAREYESQQDMIAVKDVMTSLLGRRFVMGLLRGYCHYGSRVGASTEESTMYNAGVSDVGTSIFNRMLETQPELTLKMLREDHNRKEQT
jgi:hypothetical protein